MKLEFQNEITKIVKTKKYFSWYVPDIYIFGGFFIW